MTVTLMCIILEYSSGNWVLKNIDYENTPSLPERCYVFLDQDSYPKSDRKSSKLERERNRGKLELGRAKLLRFFDAPNFLLNDTCTDLNGYFGSKGTYGENGMLESYSTWFRCLVKMVLEAGIDGKVSAAQRQYKWYEMGFFTRWDRQNHCASRFLCIGTPTELPARLKEALEKSPPLELEDPHAMHAPLMDQIVKLHDDAVWAIRDPIREIEKTRWLAKPNFGIMHEVSRHAVHVSEVLAVTIKTMENMVRRQTAIYESLPNLGKGYREGALEYTSFQLHMVKCLMLRSDSNYERLKSEITLAFNTIAQVDSALARQDNTVMKTIALLTMIFLPATFVSAFFSNTFFSFGEDGLQASKGLWVYWVITIPLTIIVVVAWRFWITPEPKSGPVREGDSPDGPSAWWVRLRDTKHFRGEP